MIGLLILLVLLAHLGNLVLQRRIDELAENISSKRPVVVAEFTRIREDADAEEVIDEHLWDLVGHAPALCPHGNAWHDCDDCDRLADFAFDAARESR